jgi:hypothetical protein
MKVKITTGDLRGEIVEAERGESHGMSVWTFELDGIKYAVPENWATLVLNLRYGGKEEEK